MTDNWNKVADEIEDNAKSAAENVQDAAKDTWNKVEDTGSEAVDAVSETVSEVPASVEGNLESAQETVAGGQDESLDAWNQAVEAAAAKAAAAKEDLGQTAEATKDTVMDAAAEVKSDAADSWNVVSDKAETSADAVKEEASGAWETAKESTQEEWQKVSDEVAKPNPNEPSTWKQEVYATADTVKTEAGEVIPSWESYKETNPESPTPQMPESTGSAELVQPVVIPPTSAPYGDQAEAGTVEPAKSYTTQTPAFQPQPVVKKKGLPAWAIVLLVIGALILLCVLLGVIFFGGIVRSLLQGAVPVQMVLSQFLV